MRPLFVSTRALNLASNPGLFITTDKALEQNPHNRLKVFVPGAHYEAFRKDVVDFFMDAAEDEPIKYIAGEPGIGKTRCVLESVESSEELRGTVCYFSDPINVSTFFTLAKQHDWHGCIIIDEYIGESRTTLERMVSVELNRMLHGEDVLKRLALLPNLLGEETADFCQLLGYDVNVFRKVCKQISGSSGLIQFNDHVAYIGSPAVAQIALIRFWNEEEELAKQILANPGQFGERFLVAINRLPMCSEKEAMLSFFLLPTNDLKLIDLLEVPYGPRFLNLIIADPDIYLPVLRRLVMEMRGHLDKIPYEGAQVGRRDFIGCLRDLGQFSEYFEDAEAIVYAFAREEVSSAYANVASSDWAFWFSAYFDFTVYPYAKRLDLLERRANEGDDLDRELVLRAVSNPFPYAGTRIPAQRVGGRLAPPEIHFIHYKQIQLAVERIPQIIMILLKRGTTEFRNKVTADVIESCFTWLEHGAIDSYSSIVMNSDFPREARQRLIAKVRHYVDLGMDRTVEPDDKVISLRQMHQQLLERSVYQMLGDETYFEEAARILSTTSISSSYFRGVFLGPSPELTESLWIYLEAIAKRAAGEDEDARQALASSVREFAYNQVVDERAYALGIIVLEQTNARRFYSRVPEWTDIALWAYKRYPSEVVAIAAVNELSEFSSATVVLAEIAKSDPEAVLNALIPKLADPYHAPFLLSSSLVIVFQHIPAEIFESWLQRQAGGVVETVAAHLPKPFMQNEKVIIPDITRAFWNYCHPSMGDVFDHALSNFDSHMFNTGVYWGYGLELFSERIKMGRQLLNDPSPGIRAWAAKFVEQSEYLHADAVRSSHLDAAMRATSE